MGQIIAHVISALGPVLTHTVTAAIHNYLECKKELENELAKIKGDNLIISEKLEGLEQYTQKEQVKFIGIPSQIVDGSDSGKHWWTGCQGHFDDLNEHDISATQAPDPVMVAFHPSLQNWW